MKSYKVYKITNTINGKVYVGITQLPYLKQRFWHHKNRKRSSGSYLHNAINHHGEEHFTIELLYSFGTPDQAKERERELISEWKLNRHRYPDGNGMNLTDGGEGSYGCRHSPESIEKMSGSNNHNYGLLGASNPTSRPIQQWTKENVLVRTFGSVREAARSVRPDATPHQLRSVTSNILASIPHEGRTPYGWKWKYPTSAQSAS